MYLLIQLTKNTSSTSNRFTFHNVSINSNSSGGSDYEQASDLHSIMYLLILTAGITTPLLALFTFHNVSINSNPTNDGKVIRLVFTFHNVSINSAAAAPVHQFAIIFTFHNVSINSSYIFTMRVSIRIYIP